MKTVDEIIEILKGQKETKVSIFCGAGISVKSGLPDVSVLLEYILKCLGIEQTDIKYLKHTDNKWSMPFESFMDAFIEHDKNTKLFDIFLLGKPNRNHFLIKVLATNACLDEIYTTNFDLLIERMLEIEPKLKFRVILENDTNVHSNDLGDNCIPIIKLHGTANNSETIRSTIMSITSGVGFENRKKLIRKAFNSSSDVLWFWGYSCSDILDITPTIKALQPKNKTIILLNHDPSIKEIDKAIIVPLDQAGVDHPLRKFNGCLIQVDSNLLVQNILGAESCFVEEPVDQSEWQLIIEEWIDSFEYSHIKFSILCHLFYNTAQYELALKYNQNAIQLNRGRDKKGEGAALSNRGMILQKTDRNAEAIKSFWDALAIFNKIEFALGVATSYNNLGYAYGQINNVEEGLNHLQTGLDYVEETTFRESKLCKGYLLKSKGELKLIEGEFQDAEASFNAALDIFQQGYKAEESEILMLKGKLYRLTGKIDESNEILREAITLATKVGYADVVQKSSNLLSGNNEEK